MRRITLGLAVIGLLFTTMFAAWALTPTQACDDIEDVATYLLARTGAEPRAQGQRLLDAHAVLCEEAPSSTTTTTTTESSTTTTPSSTSSSSTSTSSTTTSSSTTSVPPATTTTLPGPGTYACTRMLGLSQTRDTFQGYMEVSNVDNAWEGQFKGGAVLKLWTDPNFDGWTNPIWSSCGRPDRVIFQVVAMRSTNQEAELRKVISLIGQKIPSAERIDLIHLVGTPDHQLCPTTGSTVSAQHAQDVASRWMEGVAAEYTHVGMGPEMHLNCNQFRDDRHFTAAGEIEIGHQMMSWYEN